MKLKSLLKNVRGIELALSTIIILIILLIVLVVVVSFFLGGVGEVFGPLTNLTSTSIKELCETATEEIG